MAATMRAPRSAAAPTGLPRLLTGYRPDAPMSLDEHVARYGPVPRPGPRRAGALIDVIEASGLRGRGGAAFPTATKMRAVARRRGRAVVVANGTEGEPASSKDKLLLAAFPHLVLDGAVLAAQAVRADEVVVAFDRHAHAAHASVAAALEARRAAGVDPVGVRIVATPSRYVAGEETALVAFLDGGAAKPTFIPPRPFERGVGGRPTLVQNVETLAHVAQIARFGPDWYRGLGTADEPGSALVTLGGAVARPGVCELALGTPFGKAVTAGGGATGELSAFLVGGYFGTWLPAAAAWETPLAPASLRAMGASFGCGVVYAFPAGRCGVRAVARVARYLAEESAGQCGPCVHGLAAVADAMQSVADCTFGPRTLDRLHRWFGDIRGRGACNYPDGVVKFVASALDVFGDEVARHAKHRRCRAGDPPALPLPRPDRRDWGWS